MTKAPNFASMGNKTDSIDVQLSYRIVELFSEGLYSSPNKAIEELVANSFDAGALKVHVLLSSNLHDQDATIAIIDDGQGMDVAGLKQHWLIGLSNKRRLSTLPRNRQQIGKFGIGKLATYVLADRLTHISKVDGRYFSTSMDYSAIDSRINKEVEPKSPIKIPLHELTEEEAQAAVSRWTETTAFKNGGLTYETSECRRRSQPNTLQIPIAQSIPIRNSSCGPAVSSLEHYPTPAPNTDAIGDALLTGRHLIILNRWGFPLRCLCGTPSD